LTGEGAPNILDDGSEGGAIFIDDFRGHEYIELKVAKDLSCLVPGDRQLILRVCQEHENLLSVQRDLRKVVDDVGDEVGEREAFLSDVVHIAEDQIHHTPIARVDHEVKEG